MQLGLFWCAVEGRESSAGEGRESSAALQCRLVGIVALMCFAVDAGLSSLIFSSSRLWSCSKAGF